MVGRERALQVLHQALQRALDGQTGTGAAAAAGRSVRASQAQATLLVDETNLTRLANGQIHQNVAEREQSLVVKVYVGRRSGTAVTSSLDEKGVAAAVGRALEMAALSPEDPVFVSLPAPRDLGPGGPADRLDLGYDEATAALGPEGRAAMAGAMVALAHNAGVSLAGYVSNGRREVAVANSLGLDAYHRSTVADVLAVATGQNGSGYATATGSRVAALDAGQVAMVAVEKCRRGQDPRPLPAGEYEVILEEEATAELVGSILPGFEAEAVAEGRSPFAGKVGRRVLGQNITLWDDGRDPSGLPQPFDYEGVPKGKLPLVTGGVIDNVVYSTYTANKLGAARSTGHAPQPGRGAGTPFPANVFMATGEATLADMVRSVRRGLLVTRLYYNRVISPVKSVITGMTRDGTFYIEDGEIRYPVRNLRYTQSALEALCAVRDIGRSRSVKATWGGAIAVPALRIAGFNFTGTTEH